MAAPPPSRLLLRAACSLAALLRPAVAAPAALGGGAGRPGRDVFATLLDEHESYLPGVQALAASLLESNNTQPLVVITTAQRESWSPALLATAACLNLTLVRGERLGEGRDEGKYNSQGIDKLFAFGLPAARVVYLDADMVVLGALGGLFRPKGRRLLAVEDAMVGDGFNSGLLAMRPDPKIYERMKRQLESDAGSLAFGDQGFLNEFFREYWERTPKARLPLEFNVVRLLERNHGFSGRDFDPSWIRVLHFVGEKKPWMTTSFNKAYPVSQGLFNSSAEAYVRRCGSPRGASDASGFCEGEAAVPGGFAPRLCHPSSSSSSAPSSSPSSPSPTSSSAVFSKRAAVEL